MRVGKGGISAGWPGKQQWCWMRWQIILVIFDVFAWKNDKSNFCGKSPLLGDGREFVVFCMGIGGLYWKVSCVGCWRSPGLHPHLSLLLIHRLYLSVPVLWSSYVSLLLIIPLYVSILVLCRPHLLLLLIKRLYFSTLVL